MKVLNSCSRVFAIIRSSRDMFDTSDLVYHLKESFLFVLVWRVKIYTLIVRGFILISI